MKTLEDISDVLLQAGYIKNADLSTLGGVHGIDHWVDCRHHGRDIKVTWVTYRHLNNRCVEGFEVLNLDGTCPMLEDPDEIFRLNATGNFESLDGHGTICSNVDTALKMSRTGIRWAYI